MSRDGFCNCYTFFGFEVTPDGCDGGCFHLVRKGILRIEIHFAAALAQTVNVVVYGGIRGRSRDRQRPQRHLRLLMETDQISRILSHDSLMCHYDVIAKDALTDVIDTYPAAFVCITHNGDQTGEHWIAMYVNAEQRGDYFDPYVIESQHVEFTNFMNKHCADWLPNDRILQSPISTVCGQYCVAFLLFRCRNVSMHAFTHFFTNDSVANDCRVFDWVTALNKH